MPSKKVESEKIEPVIKWSGSKRALSPIITPLISSDCRYFEPFVGGGSILGSVGPRESYASDIVNELIQLWKMIKKSPESLAISYRKMWNQLQRNGHETYYEIRGIFNRDRSPEHFLFLTRTCVNGLIRFNSHGDFNNSLHHSRPGVHPDRLEVTLFEWSKRIAKTEFRNCDYAELLEMTSPGDTVYMDPPYMNNKGRYSKIAFNFEDLWVQLETLNKRSVKWILSIDGTSGNRDYGTNLDVPRALSKTELKVAAGNSPFPRLLNSRSDDVTESIFTNFNVK